MKKFFSSKKTWIVLIVLLFIFVFVNFTSSDNSFPEDVETGIVKVGEVIEIVSETGSVMAAQSVNLAFEFGGRVVEINADAGSQVNEGDILVRLDSTQQEANLTTAYARLEAEQVRLNELLSGADTKSLAVTQSSVSLAETTLENAKRNLTEVVAQQNQLVANAEKTLRTSGLQAYLVSTERENSEYSFSAPTVSGVYNSDEEGLYRIELYSSGGSSGSSFRASGLENGTEAVSTVNPTAVGTRGLYVQFPTNFAGRTQWEIPIPNTRSSSYTTNLNTYKTVIENRKLAIVNAESAVAAAESALSQTKSQLIQVSGSARDERVAAQRALLKQMQASVQSAQVAYDNMSLKASFSGLVTNVNTEVGQIVSPSVPVISLISSSNFELAVDISEVDIAEMSEGDLAEVTFDAYEDKHFKAHVMRIASNATMVDGVRVFEVKLIFDEENELIRDGLSADIEITAATREDVIAIPTRSIYEDENGKFVRVVKNGKTEIIRIKTGLRGSDGKSEVVSGLTGGEEIITFASEEAIAKLEK